MERHVKKEGFVPRKGQVTIFIIVGVVLLVLAGLFFAYRNYITESQLDIAKPIIEEVPFEFEPIKEFTTDCLKAVAEEGLEILGQQGGYIDTDGKELKFNKEDQTQADGIDFEGINMPYWLYNKAPNKENTIKLVSQKPTLDSMEQEIENYINYELISCIDGYKSIKGFSITEYNEVESTVNIVPGMVRVAAKHPIKASQTGTEVSMENFYTEIDLDIKHMFDVASAIYLAEENSSFLEKNTLNLINIFSGTEMDRLPPMTDSTFNLANTVIWPEQKVKSDVKKMLVNYVPLLRYYGSKNFYRYELPESNYSDVKQRVYDDMILPLTGAEDLEIGFSYLGWEPYFDANANSGIIQPQSTFISFFMLNFGVQRFKTVYDISYPVWVSLFDDEAFGGKGYFFNFALEANIRNNRPVETDQIIPSAVLIEKDSLFCDASQRNSGNITVNVYDAYTKKALSGAQVAYLLGDDSCTIGLTNENGQMVAAFPIATGGVVHASALDYLGSVRYLNTEIGKDDSVDIEIWPYKEINLTVEKKKLIKCDDECHSNSGLLKLKGSKGWAIQSNPTELENDEQAMVSLQRVNELDDPISFAAVINGDENSAVRIPAGKYKTSVNLILNREFVIPKEKRCVKDECFTIDELRFEQLPNGGLVWDKDTLLELNPEDYYNAKEITIYTASPALTDIPLDKRKIEDLEQIGKVENYSIIYKEQLKPEYR